jgi:hypothetical protein
MEFPRREKLATIIISCDKTVSYERIVNSVISRIIDLDADYEHMEDLFELKHLCKDVDHAARQIK